MEFFFLLLLVFLLVLLALFLSLSLRSPHAPNCMIYPSLNAPMEGVTSKSGIHKLSSSRNKNNTYQKQIYICKSSPETLPKENRSLDGYVEDTHTLKHTLPSLYLMLLIQHTQTHTQNTKTTPADTCVCVLVFHIYLKNLWFYAVVEPKSW